MLTIYKASAGSGKTFTLAYEYIKTLLGIKLHGQGRYCLNSDRYAPGGHRYPRRHAAILAITFTNAATDEMKSRIVRQLDMLADPSAQTPYTAMLLAEFGCTEAELRHAATKALAELLYDYGAFNVSTIDSFFQNVLRTFSREIDHQGDFELTIDRKDTLRQAISLMLDELNTEGSTKAPALYKWIRDYVLGNLDSGGRYNFFNRDGKILSDLSDTVDRAMDETFSGFADAIEQYLSDPERPEAFRKVLVDKMAHAFDACAALAERLEAIRLAHGMPDKAYGSLAARLATAMERPKKIGATVLKIKVFEKSPDSLCEDDFFTKAIRKAYPAAVAEATSLLIDFVAEFPRAIGRRGIYAELLDALGTLRFIGHARSTLERYLRESNMVLISDTGDLLRRIISDAEMPFIYERLGMKLTNLLIDEFQDTSPLQWHNLKPLVANSLATDNDSLIIGDEKQAIYRFRNSDSELLGSRVQTADFPDSHVLRGSAPSDNTNHRSAGDIVRFNNALFGHIATDIGAAHYGNVAQAVSPGLDTTPAYIRLTFNGNDKEGDAFIFEDMAREILRQHADGYNWRDILILVRRRSEARRVVEFLTTNHPEIRLLSSEALLLSSSSAVRAIVSMLKLVARSYEGKSATRGDDSPVYATKGDIEMMITRFNHYSSQGYDCMGALALAMEEGADASDYINSQVDVIRAENPANLVALIEAVAAHRLSAEQRTAEYAYIAALQDLAVKHLDGPDPSLASFLAEYDRNEQKWAILAPSSLDAVEVMTVHKSKGLERACVHIPFAGWELTHNRTGLWIDMSGFDEFDSDIVPPAMRVDVSAASPLRNPAISPVADAIAADILAETVDNLNASYVAFTRASRELSVHCGADGIGDNIRRAFDAILADGDLPFVPDDSGECYVLGVPTSPASKDISGNGTIEAGEYPVTFRDDTRDLVSIDDILAADDDLGDDEAKEIVDAAAPFAGTPEMQLASRRGQNLHAVLASMRTIADMEPALRRHCARAGINADEMESYRAELLHAFEVAGDQVRQWFDPANSIFPERSIYDPRTGVTSRPDRVAVRPDGTVAVVDYKFTTEARASHRRQVEAYRTLLHALGHNHVDAFLWYPLLDKIIKV